MRAVLLLLSTIGLFDSVYLQWMYALRSGPFASPGGCLTIFFSSAPGFAAEEWLLSLLSLGLYGGLILFLALSSRWRSTATLIQALFASGGVAATTFLTWKAAEVVHALCMPCLFATAIIVAICLLVFKELPRAKGIARAHFLPSNWEVGILSVALASVGMAFVSAYVAHRVVTVGLTDQAQSPAVRPWNHSEGPRDAPVKIIEFADFQCPACAQEEPVVQKVFQHYQGRISYVYRHFPLTSIHPHAEEAAEAAECLAVQNKFWPAVDVFFRNQGNLAEPMLERLAKELGSDSNGFRACLSQHEMSLRVLTDYQDGRRAGVQATPTLFVNGEKVVGALNYADLLSLVERKLTIGSTRRPPPVSVSNGDTSH